MSKLKMCRALVILLFLCKYDFVESIHISELRVPGHVEEGGQALLGCQFDLQGDRLYSVHWYKDDQEFYRFVPTNREPTSNFPVPGVFVNVARSSSTVVALEHLTKDSGGRYRCEISGEAPYFATVSEVKDVKVYLLPNNMPRMTELKNEYEIGDTLKVNCTSSRSRPRAQVKWLVNNQSAPESYLRGPWEWRSRERPDARVTTLELNFVVMPFHFKESVLTIECQVTLAPLYHDKIVHRILRIDPAPVDEASDAIQQIYEASVFSESHAQSPEVESQNKDYFKGNTAGTKVTAWVVFPSIVLLQLFF